MEVVKIINNKPERKFTVLDYRPVKIADSFFVVKPWQKPIIMQKHVNYILTKIIYFYKVKSGNKQYANKI